MVIFVLFFDITKPGVVAKRLGCWRKQNGVTWCLASVAYVGGAMASASATLMAAFGGGSGVMAALRGSGSVSRGAGGEEIESANNAASGGGEQSLGNAPGGGNVQSTARQHPYEGVVAPSLFICER
jgi:hypothetical protein